MTRGKWNANLYDTRHAFVWEKARGVVDLLAAKAGERILDLGCGTGTLSAELAATGVTVIGIDRSPEMIAEARRKFPHLQFQVGDARSLQFDEQFDAVFSNAVLHWIPEAEEVIAGVVRALRPGGRFVAEFGGKGNVAEVVKSLEQALTALGIAHLGANPWYYPGIAEYSSLLEKHGLEVREASLFDRPTELDDGESGLANWVAMFCGAFLDRVAPHQREDFLRAVETAARPALWRHNHWELDYRRLRIAASKSV